MAKFYATVVALFCLFALSLAHAPSENDDVTTSVSLPLTEASATVRVRSEPVNDKTEADSASLTTVPLTKITFRPVNRRFDVRSKRPCRHHFKFHPTVRERAEIPYGNDMILSSAENSDFEGPALHGGGRQWVRLHHHHHHHDEDSDSDDEGKDDRIKKMVFKRYDHGKFDAEKQLKKMRKHFRHETEEEKGGFMRRVRKFLGYYF